MKMLAEKGTDLSAEMAGTSAEVPEISSRSPENLRKVRVAHGQVAHIFDRAKQFKPK